MPFVLQQRLFLAYFIVLASVIAVFAVAVELSFVATVRQQATHRLVTLARAGAAAVLFTQDRSFVVDEQSLGGFDVDSKTEGLQWFDTRGNLRAERGRAPLQPVPVRVGDAKLRSESGDLLETYTLLLQGPHGNARGYVRAMLTSEAFNQGVGALNIGIIVGSILAVVAASIGGTRVARAAMARTEAGYHRLQEFTADASHELRSPLTALSATAAVALHEAPQMHDQTRNRLLAIASAAKDMQRLVDDLLILARAGRSLEREMFAVHLDSVLHEIYERYQSTAALKSLRFDVVPGEPAQVIGNPEQITRIVSNLVDNAIRYTPSGGAVRVLCSQDNAAVRITVEDSGIGITAANVRRIFDRFWRAEPGRRFDGGTGLGLAIARALAERHGGRITVSSVVNSGSTFTLTLPHRPSGLG
jgi:OmpR-family two-component system manganese-sensing sensor histidine kinase